MKIYILGLMSMVLIGCASGTNGGMQTTSHSVGSVTDFASAIRAYDASKKIDYLKEADKYATADSEKAILERKMVDYLGADKVFDVKITNSLGSQKGYSYAGMFSGGKGSNQNINISVKITPKANLPFMQKMHQTGHPSRLHPASKTLDIRPPLAVMIRPLLLKERDFIFV